MDGFGKWLQIGANVGILAGLILVGLQLQQNSYLLRTQLLYEESNRQSQFELAMLGEDPAAVWAKALTNPEDLSLREQKIAETAAYLNVENWRSVYRLSQLGLIDEEWKIRVAEEAGYQLNSPYGRALWKYISPVVEEELALYVDTFLTDDPFNPLDAQRDIMSDAIAGTGRPTLTEAERKKWLPPEG